MSIPFTRALCFIPVLGLLLGAAHIARAHESEETESAKEKEEGSVLEIGATNEWTVRNGSGANAGASVGWELTVIPEWLKVEVGGDALVTSGTNALSGVVIFKVPYELSPTTELMVGAGPKWTRKLNGPDQGWYSGAEVDVDFMFWPRKDLGWYVQPDWSAVPRTGEQSVGITVGLLIRVP
ncbi:MAG TPA: hypothetical protein VED83_08500 [Burkholderiaceae bacterium]|nr:hypothetical protein [Burkholderiaceae bacterium]